MMRKLFAVLSLAFLLGAGSAILLASPRQGVCPAGCCTGPQDCPQPACCAKR